MQAGLTFAGLAGLLLRRVKAQARSLAEKAAARRGSGASDFGVAALPALTSSPASAPAIRSLAAAEHTAAAPFAGRSNGGGGSLGGHVCSKSNASARSFHTVDSHDSLASLGGAGGGAGGGIGGGGVVYSHESKAAAAATPTRGQRGAAWRAAMPRGAALGSGPLDDPLLSPVTDQKSAKRGGWGSSWLPRLSLS